MKYPHSVIAVNKHHEPDSYYLSDEAVLWYNNLNNWLIENIGEPEDNWIIDPNPNNGDLFHFVNEEDALMFKLVWA